MAWKDFKPLQKKDVNPFENFACMHSAAHSAWRNYQWALYLNIGLFSFVNAEYQGIYSNSSYLSELILLTTEIRCDRCWGGCDRCHQSTTLIFEKTISFFDANFNEIQLLKASDSNVNHYVLISAQIIRLVLQTSDYHFQLKCCKTQQRTLLIELILSRIVVKVLRKGGNLAPMPRLFQNFTL